MTATTGLKGPEAPERGVVAGGNNGSYDDGCLRVAVARLAPCRAAVQFAVAMRARAAGEARCFTVEDVARLTELCEVAVAPDRVAAFLSVLEGRGVVVRAGDGPLGPRFMAGPGWEAWERPGRPAAETRAEQRARGQDTLAAEWWRRADAVRGRLRAAREGAGLSLAEAAAKLGPTWGKERLWKVEMGRRPISLELLLRLTQLYRVGFDEIMGGGAE